MSNFKKTSGSAIAYIACLAVSITVGGVVVSSVASVIA